MMGSFAGGWMLLFFFFVWLFVVGYLIVLATRLVNGVERIAKTLEGGSRPSAGFGESDA